MHDELAHDNAYISNVSIVERPIIWVATINLKRNLVIRYS